ncbi:hypothetical protein PSm6_35040 [Pseudomonas solani]|uniref:OmpA-like domain-containing protein n=3 Tax=Pseudomonas solani TaxID=2731552 RepID=A0ABM7LBZ3_9PSED|nr:hypothetical protein PSm6_35040 [Pseudomonas solani]
MEVRLLPVNFNKAYNDYLACTTKLLPVNFDQIKNAQLAFPGGGTALDEMGRARLEIILDYLKADPSVNHIEIDGHSDNAGNRLTNRDLSRRRALAVFDYFKANGIPESHMVMRFHGERYPLVPNSNEANRAKNRRVTLALSREAEAPPPAEAPAAAPAPIIPEADKATQGAAS